MLPDDRRFHPDSEPIQTAQGLVYPAVTIGGEPVAARIEPMARGDWSTVAGWSRQHRALIRADLTEGNWVNWLSKELKSEAASRKYLRRMNADGSVAFKLVAGDRLLGVRVMRMMAEKIEVKEPGKRRTLVDQPFLYLTGVLGCPDTDRKPGDPERVKGVGLSLLVRALAYSQQQGGEGRAIGYMKQSACGYHQKLAERYKGPDGLGLEIVSGYQVRFTMDGATSFIENVRKAGYGNG